MKSPLKLLWEFSVISIPWRSRMRPQLPVKQQVRKEVSWTHGQDQRPLTERAGLGTGGISIELIIFTKPENVVLQ